MRSTNHILSSRALLQRVLRWVLAVGLGLAAAATANAHGERAQEPYLRTRTVQFYDVDFDKTAVAVNEQFVVKGRFRLMEDWPDAVSQPDVVFLSTYSPGPVVTRVESYLNGQPARQSFAKLEKGRDYDFKIVLKGRVPGRYHIHPMLSIKGSGPLAGPGEWIEISGNKADFREPVTTMTGDKVDNLEFYGLGRALAWYGFWIALAAFWLLFWLVRPLLVPRWIALQKGREDLLISGRDLGVGIALGVLVVGVVFGGYAQAKKAYPYVVPLQAGTNKTEPLPRGRRRQGPEGELRRPGPLDADHGATDEQGQRAALDPRVHDGQRAVHQRAGAGGGPADGHRLAEGPGRARRARAFRRQATAAGGDARDPRRRDRRPVGARTPGQLPHRRRLEVRRPAVLRERQGRASARRDRRPDPPRLHADLR